MTSISHPIALGLTSVFSIRRGGTKTRTGILDLNNSGTIINSLISHITTFKNVLVIYTIFTFILAFVLIPTVATTPCLSAHLRAKKRTYPFQRVGMRGTFTQDLSQLLVMLGTKLGFLGLASFFYKMGQKPPDMFNQTTSNFPFCMVKISNSKSIDHLSRVQSFFFVFFFFPPGAVRRSSRVKEEVVGRGNTNLFPVVGGFGD